MPRVSYEKLAIALDMAGDPNRCRHCYLGHPARGTLGPEDLRWTASQFRNYAQKQTDEPAIRELFVSSWFREPDYSDDYRALYELECELSDGRPFRFELLSTWRIARDEAYLPWAKKVGPRRCQITFFGLERTTDWFCRRKGAFADNLVATERLLENEMIPRWQIFLTRKGLPELEGLLAIARDRHVRERVRHLGEEFVIFAHTPSPDGEARSLEPLRPTIDEMRSVPAELIESSKAHFGREELWRTEAALRAEILNEEDRFPYAYPLPEQLWFLIANDWGIYSNQGTLEPWWKLGNLKTDLVGDILDAFRENGCLGLRTVYEVPANELVARCGDPESQRVYTSAADLLSLYVGDFCDSLAREGG